MLITGKKKKVLTLCGQAGKALVRLKCRLVSEFKLLLYRCDK